MELVGLSEWRSATFEIRDVCTFVGDYQRAFELTGIGGVDAEVGHQLDRATNSRRDVRKRTVAEDGRIQAGEEIVGVRHNRTQVLLYKIRVIFDRLAERTEDDAEFAELLLEGGRNRYRIEHCIDRYPGQLRPFLERNAELLESSQHFRVDIVEALGRFGNRLRRGVVVDVLVVDFRILDVRPLGLAFGVVQLDPVPVGL